MPFVLAGQVTDPSVSEPIAPAARLAAIPAPLPLLDPHGDRSNPYGLRVSPPTPLQPEMDRTLR